MRDRYRLCDQTVTVYHFENGSATRTVYDKAYLEFGKTQDVGRTGSSETGDFLLVVPGPSRACSVGDKVILGRGPDVPATDVAAWWRSFIPSKVDGLLVVRKSSVKLWNGEICHTEAGG